jgi:hypothetical protein
MVAEGEVIVENTTVDTLPPIHEARLLPLLSESAVSISGVYSTTARPSHESRHQADGDEISTCDVVAFWRFRAPTVHDRVKRTVRM